MSERATGTVIGTYSTSFSLAVRLLDRRTRTEVRNLYAMVRIADEIVDGAAAQAGSDVEKLLGEYEQAVLAAPGQRFHTDPVLHAYAGTARRCRFEDEHIRAFFWSMRQDITPRFYSSAELERYIYGSAEVIGLLCLRIFLEGEPGDAELEHGARSLGAAFQKVNFLRDIRVDEHSLGRSYLGEVDEAAKKELIAGVRADLRAAWKVIPRLPRSARLGVSVAAELFGELVDRLDAASISQIEAGRVRVSDLHKARIVARMVVRG
ncbi:phytoene/squalene synthase family protein [Corynebacterium sp. A21]|uniref:phytoene/squalene synthase family protein n=1 Tax=Corynebacterium sp. A21 TaxID=3457318 RepID=UPI003FD30402